MLRGASLSSAAPHAAYKLPIKGLPMQLRALC